MNTLYTRIVLFSVVIVLVSFASAFFAANFAYSHTLTENYELKMEKVGAALSKLGEQMANSPSSVDELLDSLSKLGYQLYAIDEAGHIKTYGRAFDDVSLPPEIIDTVLKGGTYQGMRTHKQSWFVPTVFENRLELSYGTSAELAGERHALFVRPDMVQQTEEVRILVAVLLIGTFVISLVLIAIKTRYLVRPLHRLTDATMKLENGNYDVQLDITRKDEIGVLARRFTRMAAVLGQVDAMQKQFVANVSHEIQSPLTSIRGLARQLLDHPLPPEQERKYLQIIDDESSRLSGLGRQLLTLAALERGKESLKHAPFRLDEQLRQIIIVQEPQWGEKNLQLDLELEEVVIHGDPGLLHQVWSNLLSNGIKFTEPGGQLHIKCRKLLHEVEVIFSDTGEGIPVEALPYLFDRFYKYDKRKGNAHGTGLGLSIVKRIVELHEGTIRATNDTGAGAAFSVRLPVREI